MLKSTTLQFLRSLDKNNNKPWFEKHRGDYENAKADFAAFVETVLKKHAKKDPSLAELKVKDCLFRINRDVRFSKDKSPYKNNFGAYLNAEGKKSLLGGYYFHLQPGHSFVGGGLWSPLPPELKKVRQEIDYCFKEFTGILSSKKFKKVYGDLSKSAEYSLVKVPQGFDKENPAAAYLRLKSFVAMRPISDKELQSADLINIALESYDALQPLLAFLNRAVKDEG